MIRINLISEGRRPVAVRKSRPKLALGSQDPSLYILAAGVVVGLLVTLGFLLMLNNKLEAQKDKVAKAKKEEQALRKILDEVDDFKKKRDELNRKIDIIEDLNSQRKGPMEVMDQVSKSLPELVWLTNMEMRGKTVKLKGQAMNTNAIATYIENLKTVTIFKEPETKNVRRASRGTYTFELTFKMEPPPEPETEDDELEAADEAA